MSETRSENSLRPHPLASVMPIEISDIQWVVCSPAEANILFFDSEFSRLPNEKEPMTHWQDAVEILSAAFVLHSEHRDPLMAYFHEARPHEVLDKCASFTKENVVPHLGAEIALEPSICRGPNVTEQSVRFARGQGEGVEAISKWFGTLRASLDHRPLVVAVDWVFGALILRRLGINLPILWLSAHVGWERMEEEVVIASGLQPHNALHDAISNVAEFERSPLWAGLI